VERKRPQEDRNRAFKTSPGDEYPLAVPQPGREQQRTDDDRPRDEGEDQREQQAVEPDTIGAELSDVDREPEHGEDRHLGQARQ